MGQRRRGAIRIKWLGGETSAKWQSDPRADPRAGSRAPKQKSRVPKSNSRAPKQKRARKDDLVSVAPEDLIAAVRVLAGEIIYLTATPEIAEAAHELLTATDWEEIANLSSEILDWIPCDPFAYSGVISGCEDEIEDRAEQILKLAKGLFEIEQRE